MRKRCTLSFNGNAPAPDKYRYYSVDSVGFIISGYTSLYRNIALTS